ALKSSAEFTRLYPSLVVVIGYACAFYFMTLTLKTLPVGITYAIWSGAGIVLITLIAAWQFQEMPTPATMLGMAFIIAGIAIMHTNSAHG
ncbi:MAG: multidrug efflux SMR transporter, partial [Ghiorsea sp.]